MKICPACQTTYDDAQNFCLKDGTSLIVTDLPPARVEPLETIEENTVVRPMLPLDSVSARQTNYAQPVRSTPVVAAPPIVVEKKSNTAKVVALTALATLLLVALAAGGTYLALQNRNQQVAQVNNNVVARPKNSNVSNTNVIASTNANVNAVSTVVTNSSAIDLNANTTNLNANVSPAVPTPSLNQDQAEVIEEDVSDTINDWKDSTESGDLNSHLSFYAPTVDYYRGGKMSVDRVRADRQKAFNTYPDISIKISNVKVTPDSSGDRAIAVFDKAWRFENDNGETSEGKVQQQLTLEKRGERWFITGEKDLKLYSSTRN